MKEYLVDVDPGLKFPSRKTPLERGHDEPECHDSRPVVALVFLPTLRPIFRRSTPFPLASERPIEFQLSFTHY